MRNQVVMALTNPRNSSQNIFKPNAKSRSRNKSQRKCPKYMPFMRGPVTSQKDFQQIGANQYLSLKAHSLNSDGMVINKLVSVRKRALPSPADLLKEILHKDRYKKFNEFKEDDGAETRTVVDARSGSGSGKDRKAKLKESKNTNTDFYSDSADDVEVSKPLQSIQAPSLFSKRTIRKNGK